MVICSAFEICQCNIEVSSWIVFRWQQRQQRRNDYVENNDKLFRNGSLASLIHRCSMQVYIESWRSYSLSIYLSYREFVSYAIAWIRFMWILSPRYIVKHLVCSTFVVHFWNGKRKNDIALLARVSFGIHQQLHYTYTYTQLNVSSCFTSFFWFHFCFFFLIIISFFFYILLNALDGISGNIIIYLVL